MVTLLSLDQAVDEEWVMDARTRLARGSDAGEAVGRRIVKIPDFVPVQTTFYAEDEAMSVEGGACQMVQGVGMKSRKMLEAESRAATEILTAIIIAYSFPQLRETVEPFLKV
jgi:hypothetical protein